MSLPRIGARTEQDVTRTFATDPIHEEAGGGYLLQVTSAYDSYTVNPDDVDNAERKRYIFLRVEAVDVRRTRSKDFAEDDDSLEMRKAEIGKFVDIYVRLDRRRNVKVLEGSLSLLCNIAGTSQQQFEDALNAQGLLKKAYLGTEKGEDRYDMGVIAEETHVNCSALMGRVFGGVVEFRDHEGKTYVDLNPWQHFSLPDDRQPVFKGEAPVAGSAFEGEDRESADAKERFDTAKAAKEGAEKSSGDGATTRRAPRVSAGAGMKTADSEGGDYEFSPNDDLPF